MRKSILGFVIIIFVVAIIIAIAWFLLNNIAKINGESVKVLNIALIAYG